MGQSVSKEDIVAIARAPVSYSPPLGPPVRVRAHATAASLPPQSPIALRSAAWRAGGCSRAAHAASQGLQLRARVARAVRSLHR